MLTYRSSRTWTYPLNLDHLVSGAETPQLSVDAWGLTSWPGSDPDHHMTIALNVETLIDERFDGQSPVRVSTAVPGGLLAAGANTMEFTMPGDNGFDYDMVVLDRYTVTYPRAFVARDGRLEFEAAGGAFEVSNLPSPNIVVYRIDWRGNARQLVSTPVQPDGQGGYKVAFSGLNSP
jgi:hypothetical protein